MSREYASPYAQQAPQYPSQSEDYLSLQIGGPGKTSTPSRPAWNNGGNQNRGRGNGNFYQNKQRGHANTYNRLYNSYTDRSGTSSSGQQFTPNHRGGRWNNNGGGGGDRGGGGRQWRGGGFRQHNNRGHRQPGQSTDISAYVHPSMLEDPWRDLMLRQNAIRNSKLNLQTTAPEDVKVSTLEEATESGSESGSDNAVSDET